jgi:Zn-dependent protease with chaperone function
MALIAHEMGHHLNGHTLHRGGSEPALELEADEFAGFVLRKLGATLREAQEVMYLISGSQSSATHPARNDRMLAIEKGWTREMNEEYAAKLRPVINSTN